MSECPGRTLEDFLEWQYSVNKNIVKAIAELYEPYRDAIEQRLDSFDDELQSWRGFAQYVDEGVPEDIVKRAKAILLTWNKSPLPDNEIIEPPKERKTNKGEVLVTDNNYFIEITKDAPFGLKCTLINRPAGIAYMGILNRKDKFATHYAPLPTFKD